MRKSYIQGVNDCIEVLANLYQQKHDGHYYNKEIRDSLEQLKVQHINEFNELIGPLMNIHRLLQNAGVSPEIIGAIIGEVQKYITSSDKKQIKMSGIIMSQSPSDYDMRKIFADCGGVITMRDFILSRCGGYKTNDRITITITPCKDDEFYYPSKPVDDR